MLGRRRVAALCGIVVACAFLQGCAIVDQYSYRAVGYNLEAEQAQLQALLLNIIRASQRRPMQFTSVQSITGTASSTGNASVGFPFGQHQIQTSLATGTIGGSVSGGPSFTVPVLDTQEFYQGIMNPISGLLIDFFVHEGYPSDEIFNLFIEKIVVRRRDGCTDTDHLPNCELVFINYPGDDLSLDMTQALIEHLLNLGLSTEQFPEDKSKSKACASDSSSSTRSSTTNSSSSKDCTPPPPKYRFCFSPRFPRWQADVPREARCGALTKAAAAERGAKRLRGTGDHGTGSQSAGDRGTGARGAGDQGTSDHTTTQPAMPTTAPARTSMPTSEESINSDGKRTTTAPFRLSREFIRYMEDIANSEHDDDDAGGYRGNLHWFADSYVTIGVYTRSTEGIIYYLGEIARRQLHPELYFGAGRRTVQIKIIRDFVGKFDRGICPQDFVNYPEEKNPCFSLFVLNEGPALGSALSVGYNGLQYSIPNDGEARAKSMHVLSLLKQLLAVNTSAKSLPQTSIISVLTP